MAVSRGNLFDALPSLDAPGECIELLRRTSTMTLERIVSFSSVTPKGEWYDQAWDEWVLLVQGAAKLRLEGETTLLELRTGDYVLLPAHRRHRVEWTDPEGPVIWLALHHAPGP